MLHEASRVTGSKNEVLVWVFVQWEPTGRQLKVQVIQRGKIDLKKKNIASKTYIFLIFVVYV